MSSPLAAPPISSRGSNTRSNCFPHSSPLDSHRQTAPPNMSSSSFISPSHPVSFEDMLRQFRKLSSTPSCNSSLSQSANFPLVQLESFAPHCISRSVNSQPPSPLPLLGAPFVPVSCQLSKDLDVCIPPSHGFHNDPPWNSSPASSSSSEGVSLPSCFVDEPLSASRPLFEEFRYTQSRVLRVGTLVLYHVSPPDKCILKAPEGLSHAISITCFVLYRGKSTVL
jgi:hypothetical protein